MGSLSAESSGSSGISRLNDSVYELHRPLGKPRIQVVFFHGLQPGNCSQPELSTWESADGSCYWPQTWLVEELPGAHVFAVSCPGGLRSSSIDLYIVGENLLWDLLQENIGQVSSCPLVLVGHSFGGLVIKEICCQAHHFADRDSRRNRVATFLNNLKGIFYYATPHRGSPVASQLVDIIGSPLMEYFKMLSTDTARLNDTFDKVSGFRGWRLAGLGENCPTKGLFKTDVVVVPEASARVEDFNVVEGADHLSICRPEGKHSRGFSKLKGFLDEIACETEEPARPENFQSLPKKFTGIDFQLQQTKCKLKIVTTLGLAGMGGVGKTTLAMALFNDLCRDFEYTSFVPNVKQNADTVERQVWSNMHHNGKKVRGDEKDWSDLRGRQVLIVLDDISGDCHVRSLIDRVNVISDSRLIVTSREQDLLETTLDDVHDVQFLDKINGQSLFMKHAFPSEAIPPTKLADLVEKIVKKCEGLPLTLEILGQYLKGKKHVKDWEQTLNALDKADAVSAFNERLWDKLRPSYDGLTETEQKIFLDATTFFGGQSPRWTLRDAKAAWRGAYGIECENVMWETLVKRSLVYNVQEHERIQVHEQLGSLGRKIAAASSNNFACRIWDQRVALKLLQSTDEPDSTEIHALQLSADTLAVCRNRIQPSYPILCKFKKLRYLEVLAPVTIDKSLLSKLVLLHCVGLESPFPALLSHLVVLKLYCENVKCLPSSIGSLSALRILKLSGDGSTISSLPDEIGRLSELEVLELRGFNSLGKLPKTFGQLSKLKDLKLDYCPLLQALPESFGGLSSLEHLHVERVGLQDLPSSFADLSTLVLLKVINCQNLETLPESFGNLLALIHLEFDKCQLQSLPESLGQLENLQYLKVSTTSDKLKMLPDSLAALKDLSHLIIDCAYLEEFPEYIMHLPSLQTLELCNYLGDRPYGLSETAYRREFRDKVCHIQKKDGCFSVSREATRFSSERRLYLLHSRAMKKISKGDYAEAIVELSSGNLGQLADEVKGFLFQEIGIAKRVAGDLQGALEDFSFALEAFINTTSDLDYIQYHCWKHLAYVKFLLGDLEGAQDAYRGALKREEKSLKRFQGTWISPCLGEEPVTFTIGTELFILKGSKAFEEREMRSSHARVMEKVRVSDFGAALAIWDDFDAKVLGYHNQKYFLQERGILRRKSFFQAIVRGAFGGNT